MPEVGDGKYAKLEQQYWKERDLMAKRGELTYSNGQTVFNPRRNKFNEPLNIGYRDPKSGKTITTKGVVPKNFVSKRLLTKMALSETLEMVGYALDAVDMAMLYTGMKKPHEVFPFAELYPDPIAEFEQDLFPKLLGDYETAKGAIPLLKSFEGLEFLYLSEVDLYGVLSKQL